MAAELLVEQQRLRVEAEIQQAIKRVFDVASVRGSLADDGIHEGTYSATARRTRADMDSTRSPMVSIRGFMIPP